MNLDVLQQLDVAGRPAEADPGLRAGAGETALVHEDPLLLGVDQLDDVGVGGQVPARAQLRHLGVDRLHASLARDRHAMVAVDDEIRVADLVHDDRREVAVGERLLHPPPALADLRPARKEVAIEVLAAAFRPDDLPQRDGAQADVAPLERTQAPCRLLERQQVGPVAAPAYDARESRVGTSPPRSLERRHPLPGSDHDH